MSSLVAFQAEVKVARFAAISLFFDTVRADITFVHFAFSREENGMEVQLRERLPVLFRSHVEDVLERKILDIDDDDE